MLDKRRIIYYLVAIVVALLVINIILSKVEKPKQNKNIDELSVAKVNDLFLKTLATFDISDDWIKNKKLRKGTYDSINTKFSIEVPTAISIPLVLKDLNEKFISHPVELIATEGKYGYSNLKIISNGNVKLDSEFRYLKKTNTVFNRIAFIICNYNEANDEEKEKLFSLAYPFGVILPLEEESQNIAEFIKSKDYNYFIELSNDADFVKFELDEENGLEILSNNIRNIISYFNSPRFFFLDKSKKNFSNSAIEFIQEKFQERGREVIFNQSILKLKGENKADLNSLFNFHIDQLKDGEFRVFRIDLNDWFLLQDELNNFIKTGNKIVLPSKLL